MTKITYVLVDRTLYSIQMVPKVIARQIRHQIRIRGVELIMGKLLSSKLNFGISRNIGITTSKYSKGLLLVRVPTSSSWHPVLLFRDRLYESLWDLEKIKFMYFKIPN